MDRVGIEFLSVLGLPPVEFVKLAADLGCHFISSGVTGSSVNPEGFPPYNLIEDTQLRREMYAAMLDLDVRVSLGEGFLVTDIRARARELAAWRELDIERVNIVSIDPDLDRTLDQFAIFAELALGEGMSEVVIEFAPVLTICDLMTALKAIDHVARPEFKLVVDTMHFGRTGGTAAALQQIDPKVIGYVQLSDVQRQPVIRDYMQEAMMERLSPGEGELPLGDFLAAVPRDIVVSLEVPQASKALAGIGPYERLRPAVAATAGLLASLPA
jgi:sugar phosphate isomerase/epimerase